MLKVRNIDIRYISKYHLYLNMQHFILGSISFLVHILALVLHLRSFQIGFVAALVVDLA